MLRVELKQTEMEKKNQIEMEMKFLDENGWRIL